MRKVIIQQFISADGFVADRDDSTSFFEYLTGKEAEEIDQDLLEFIGTIDNILLGANTYKFFLEFWPTEASKEEMVADDLNATPKVVFSKTLKEAPWGAYEAVKIVDSDAAEYIKYLKDQPGKDMVIWGSISLCKSLLHSGVVDEVQLRIVPVAIGKGTLLFPEEQDSLKLELLDTKVYKSGVVFNRYGLKFD